MLDLEQAVSGSQMACTRLMECKSIEREQLEHLAPFIQQELRKLALLGVVSPPAALRQIFIALYGDRHRSPPERRLFLSVTAPLTRRVAIEIAPAGERFEPCGIGVADFGTWLAWPDKIDPSTARIIDLYLLCWRESERHRRCHWTDDPGSCGHAACDARGTQVASKPRQIGDGGNGVEVTGTAHGNYAFDECLHWISTIDYLNREALGTADLTVMLISGSARRQDSTRTTYVIR